MRLIPISSYLNADSFPFCVVGKEKVLYVQ